MILSFNILREGERMLRLKIRLLLQFSKVRSVDGEKFPWSYFSMESRQQIGNSVFMYSLIFLLIWWNLRFWNICTVFHTEVEAVC